MKVLIMSSKFPPVIGGGETYSYQVAHGLSTRGHQVAVVTNKLSNLNRPRSSYKVFEINGFDEEEPTLQEAVPGLFEILKDLQPDIVHVNNYIPLFFFSLVREASPRTKVVFSIHNTPDFPRRVFGLFNHFPSEVYFARKLLYEINPLLVLGSKHFVKSVRELTTGRTRTKLLYFGADTDFFNPNNTYPDIKKDLGVHKNDILILCPSRIIERKGIAEAINSLLLLPQNTKIFFPAAFRPKDKKYFGKLNLLVDENKLRERVIWGARHYAYQDMPAVYAGCDIVVLPSYYEGFSMAVLEAMSMKKIVVSCDVNGVNEAIIDSTNGLLAKEKSHVSLAEKINIALSNSKQRRQIVDNAYKKVILELNLQSYW